MLDDDIAALRPRIMKLAGRLTGNKFDADDLTQNALVRALEKQNQYQEGNLGGWVAVIAYREFYSGKAKVQEVPVSPENINLIGLTQPNQEDTVALREVLDYMAANLPPYQVDALLALKADNYKATQYRWLARKKLNAWRDNENNRPGGSV